MNLVAPIQNRPHLYWEGPDSIGGIAQIEGNSETGFSFRVKNEDAKTSFGLRVETEWREARDRDELRWVVEGFLGHCMEKTARHQPLATAPIEWVDGKPIYQPPVIPADLYGEDLEIVIRRRERSS